MNIFRSMIVLVAAGVFIPQASAAVLDGSFTALADETIIVDAEGTTDWGIWAPSAGSTPNGRPTYYKADAAVIGDATFSGSATDFVEVSGADDVNYQYDTTIVSNRALSAVPYDTDGVTLTIEIAGDPSVNSVVRVYVGTYRGALDLSASLAGSDDYTYEDAIPAEGTKRAGYFELTFRPDLATDRLTINLIADEAGGTASSSRYSHIFLDAVTVSTSPVPEPGSMALLSVGACLVLVRRRKAFKA